MRSKGSILGMMACMSSILITTHGNAQMPILSEDGQTAIDDFLDRVVHDTYIPGVVALVTNRDGVIYAGAFGSRNVAQGVPMTVDSIFRIASMTKPITSAAVMMLVEEGDVGLDDPASNYLPGRLPVEVFETFDPTDNSFTSRPANGQMTVRHLLAHTSGLGYNLFNEILFPLLRSQRPPATQLNHPLLHDPGARWTYGESTRVLGYLVESVSGQGVDAFLAEHVFTPLGMNETGFSVVSENNDRLVTFHTLVENGLVEQPNPEGTVSVLVRGDGGLFSTARDYARFMRLILNGGLGDDGVRLLAADTVDLMAQNHIGDLRVELMPAPNPAMSRPFPLGAGADTFGLGFQITAEHDSATMRSPGSLSWAGINNTQFWIDPDAGIGAVLLMQYRPFYDDTAIETLQGFEALVYEHLQ
ncbi:MAG: beta-lactamase family protein [Proteobacteria bacterium]|nr:beta-lactamase family protein [Pseudomonadota bacterium]